MRASTTLVVAMAALIALPLLSFAKAEDTPGLAEVWKGEEFQKRLIGSYGINSEIEPGLTEPERLQWVEEIAPLLGAEDKQPAIEALTAAVAVEDSSAMFDFALANLHFQADELEEAAKHYGTAVKKFPAFRRAYKNLGFVQVRTGDYSGASVSLGKVIELGGGDGLTYGLLGYAYSALDEHVPAESAYRSAMLLDPSTLDWKVGLTQSVMKQQKYGEAVTLCEELIAKYPERADFWLMQANAWIGLKQPLKAAENFELVERMGKATPGSQRMLGDIYVNEGLWDLAADAYSRALVLDDEIEVSQPLRWIGILAQRGAIEQARELLDDVRGLYGSRLTDEDRKSMLKLEARMAVASGEEGEDVVEVLEQVVDLDPLDGEALILLGQHYARADQLEKAEFYYERAESLEQFEADASIRHAQLLVQKGEYAKAVPLLKRAQEIKEREDVARFLEQVEKAARQRR